MRLQRNWSDDFGQAETENGAKKQVLLRHKFFRSNFKAEWEYGVWTKIRFLAAGFVRMRQSEFAFFHCFLNLFDRFFKFFSIHS